MLWIFDSEPLGDFLAGIALELEDSDALSLAVSELNLDTMEAPKPVK